MQPVKKFIMKEDPKHIRISEFNYPLPDERIAKFPLPVRDQSKLLVYRHGEVSEDRFTSLPSYLPTGSLMIFNNTKVIQARLHFRKETGALIEVFCLEPIEPNDYVLNFQQTEHAAWLCMIGNLKKWKEGTLKREMTVKEQPITLTATRGECHGTSHWVDFRWDNPEITFADILEVFGELPIPPYLNRDTQESDKETYQTVYSKIKGSVAAPTAGLHFTPRVLNALKEKGVDLEELTLHVGAGTFKPVKSAEIEGHEMHTEYISVSRGTIENLIAHNGKAIAVGTTSVRTLESLYHIGVTLLKNPNATEEEIPGITDGEPQFYQKLDYPNSVTFVGSGKLQEIKEYVVENEIGLVIFDDELSAKQLRNIEKELQVKILDRTNLILDIFARRAQTAHAKTQVELAQYKYMLPRLTRLWTHLERQRGGVGMRGPGETQLETDKRIILDKISKLKRDLVEIDKQKSVQRKNRGKMVRVALVGYTNVGKSTLMNLLSKSEVFAENKLFATLDTTVRKVIVDNLPFLLSDTVGFIRKLPTELVESFKSTLDEVREADLLVHVVDISHPTFEEQIEVVNRTLSEIDKTEKPMIMVFNKIDAFTFVPKDEDDLTPRTRENIDLDELKRTWMNKMQDNCIFISAKERTNIDALKALLYERVKQIHITRFPYNDFLFQQYDEE